MSPAPGYAGIDVAQAEVVIALAPGGERWASATTPAALGEAVARRRGHAPALVVLEGRRGSLTSNTVADDPLLLTRAWDSSTV